VSKRIRHHSFDSYFKTVVIKHADQITAKQKENTASSMSNI
jgi:hypothetical protein